MDLIPRMRGYNASNLLFSFHTTSIHPSGQWTQFEGGSKVYCSKPLLLCLTIIDWKDTTKDPERRFAVGFYTPEGQRWYVSDEYTSQEPVTGPGRVIPPYIIYAWAYFPDPDVSWKVLRGVDEEDYIAPYPIADRINSLKTIGERPVKPETHKLFVAIASGSVVGGVLGILIALVDTALRALF